MSIVTIWAIGVLCGNINRQTPMILTPSVKHSAFLLMDEIQSMLLEENVEDAMHKLVIGLNDLRLNSDSEEWSEFANGGFLSHPVADMIHQDPFTHHSYSKPRGYSGDAELLDYIYGIRPLPANTTHLGKQIFKYTSNAPGPRSVCSRRDLLRVKINQTAGRVKSANILSIACGHLREFDDKAHQLSSQIGKFVAFDQDEESLKVVQRTKLKNTLEIVPGSVRSLLTGQKKFKNLDFVYAAGLYDYLSKPIASRLTELMFEMLNPGGTLLIANFAPSLVDIGYMETFMKWQLIYRKPDEMAELVESIPEGEIQDCHQYWDEHENITFLELHKK